MKRTVCTLLALGGIASTANAQSSVTLYGIVDAGLLYTSNAGGAKLYSVSSGNLQGSRWGLKGSEDLGGDLRTVFVLENGFNVFNGRLGQNGEEFGRQAYLGISSSHLGSVYLGRQYDSVVDFTGPLAAGSQWASYYGSHPGDLDNLDNTNRVNNAIKYVSPIYAGFSFGGLYSLGGVAGDISRNQIWSVGAGYSSGGLILGVGYLNIRNPNFSFWGNDASSSTTASNMSGSPVYSGYASAATQEIISAAGAYTFGAATLGATYTNTAFDDLGRTGGATLNPNHYTDGERFNNVELNFKYQITPSFLAGVAYDYTRGYGVNSVQYHLGMIGADYFFSKRTDVYVDGLYLHATGTDSTGKSAVAAMDFMTPSSTENQTAILVGIRHKF